MDNKQGYQPKNIKDERPIVPPQGGTGEIKKEMVDKPDHYGGTLVIEYIEALEALPGNKVNFSRASAIKYISRGGMKDSDKEIEDLKKAVWYIEREMRRIKYENNKSIV